jgi:predicted nucleic acid-binding Zn ribbon protein
MAAGYAPVSINGALREALDGLKLGFLLHEAKLRRRWSEVVGERAAEMAEMESLKDFVLNVRVQQAAWRQELHFQREAIRERANGVLGSNLVRDVRLF